MRYVEISNSAGKVYDRIYEKDGKLVSQMKTTLYDSAKELNEDGVTLEVLTERGNGYFNVSDIIEGDLPK